MEKSTHKCEVVPVILEPHPNADTLSVVKVWGYQVCVRTVDWVGRTLGAYVVPDSMVPLSNPLFAFLDDKKGKDQMRVRAKKLRGTISYGLLIPAPEGTVPGDDVAEMLGITRYEPPVKLVGCGHSSRVNCVSPPKLPTGDAPHYDVDAFQRYAANVFTKGEPVFVTEKVDGANGRFVFWDGQMYCGSRKMWPEDAENNPWWIALRRTPAIEVFCRQHPGWVVYGEVFGAVQDLHYGRKSSECDFVAFDLLRDGQWVDAKESRDILMTSGIPVVPLIAWDMPYDFDALMALAESASAVPGADHYREGVVIKPMVERWCSEVGRAQLKIVSAIYLESEGKEKPFKK